MKRCVAVCVSALSAFSGQISQQLRQPQRRRIVQRRAVRIVLQAHIGPKGNQMLHRIHLSGLHAVYHHALSLLVGGIDICAGIHQHTYDLLIS